MTVSAEVPIKLPSLTTCHLRPSGIVTTQLERWHPSYRAVPPVTSATAFAAVAWLIPSYSSSHPKVISLIISSVTVIVFSFLFPWLREGLSPAFVDHMMP